MTKKVHSRVQLEKCYFKNTGKNGVCEYTSGSPPPPLMPELQPGSNLNRLVSTNWRAFLFCPTSRGFLALWRLLGCDHRRTHPGPNRQQKGSNGPKGSKSRDTPPSCPVTETSQKQGRNELAKNGVLCRNASSNLTKNLCPAMIGIPIFNRRSSAFQIRPLSARRASFQNDFGLRCKDYARICEPLCA